MKLTRREKLMLFILGLAAAIYLSVNYVIFPQYERLSKADSSREETARKLQEYQLMADPANPVYFQYKEMDNKVKGVSALFFPELKQDKIITVLEDCFKAAGITPKSIEFSSGQDSTGKKGTENAAVTQSQIDRLTDIVKRYSGDKESVPEPRPLDHQDATQSPKEIPVDLKVKIVFESGYEEVVSFIKALESYPRRIIINNVQSLNNIQSSASSNGLLTTTLDLTFIAVPKLHEQDQDFYEWPYDGPYGKSDPFTPFSGYAAPGSGSTPESTVSTPVGTVEDVSAKENFFFMLNSVHADLTTVVLSRYNDKNKSSYLYADNPGLENVTYEFLKQGGRYYYRYRTQSESYPQNYSDLQEFKPEGTIGIDIFSCKRLESDDQAGANITMLNHTDLKVVVRVKNDDPVKPRVNFMEKVGEIEIREEQTP